MNQINKTVKKPILGITSLKDRKRLFFSEIKSYERKRQIKIAITNDIETINNSLKMIGLKITSVNVDSYKRKTENIGNSIEKACKIILNEIEEEEDNEETCLRESIILLLKCLKWKDVNNISDLAYHRLVKELDKNLPNIDKIRNLRGEINELSTFVNNEYGYFIDFEEKLENVLRKLYNMSQIKENELIKIKLCGDGTNVGRVKKMFNFSFSVINEPSICQSAKGHYTIGIFEISEENYEVLSNCLKAVLEKIKAIDSITIDIGDGTKKTFNIQKYLCGDLKFLAIVLGINAANANQPCIWCKCDKSEFYNLKKVWSITDKANGARTHDESSRIIKSNKKENEGYLFLKIYLKFILF